MSSRENDLVFVAVRLKQDILVLEEPFFPDVPRKPTSNQFAALGGY